MVDEVMSLSALPPERHMKHLNSKSRSLSDDSHHLK